MTISGYHVSSITYMLHKVDANPDMLNKNTPLEDYIVKIL